MKNRIKTYFGFVILLLIGFAFFSEHYKYSSETGVLITCFSPPILFLTFELIRQKLKRYTGLDIVLSISSFITICLVFLHFLILTLSCFSNGTKINIPKEIYPTIETYKQELNINYPEKPFLLEHFPSSIPENATDFSCRLNSYFNYLTFKTDKSYIDHIINKNKKNILRKDYAENICKSYELCDNYPDIKPNDLVYILKRNPHTQNNYYTLGIITPQNNEKILFFFTHYKLERFIGFFGYYHPQEEEYPFVIKNLPTEKYRIKHFPSTLPENATNYFFQLEGDAHGWNFNYLSINTDKLYINNLLKKYKSNIVEKIDFYKVGDFYRDIRCSLDIDSKNEGTINVYILKNENDDEHYTSGFVISEETQRVIFFYANYNLKLAQ